MAAWSRGAGRAPESDRRARCRTRWCARRAGEWGREWRKARKAPSLPRLSLSPAPPDGSAWRRISFPATSRSRREEGKERKEREREGGRGTKKLTDSAESFETLNLASEF